MTNYLLPEPITKILMLVQPFRRNENMGNLRRIINGALGRQRKI
jgi:hypothetical protein